MAKKKINAKKKKEIDFEIPNDTQTEIENPNGHSEPIENVGDADNSEIKETDTTNQPEQSEAEKELAKMLGDDNFSEPLSENSSATIIDDKGKRGRKKKIVEDETILIPGELVVHICNNVSAGGLSLIDKWISKNPLPVGALSLTEEQAIKLAPLAEKMIASWQMQKDPTTAFFLSFGAMSISNYILMKAMQAKENNPVKVKL